MREVDEMRLRWLTKILKDVDNPELDYKLLYDDGKSDKYSEINSVSFEHESRAIIFRKK
jgi:hypothetical protein